uniref:DUF4283 domain-containing protein n=1 Tax=Cannabis sativa TaxID=3483 RepID=A0A803PL01_CANSA
MDPLLYSLDSALTLTEEESFVAILPIEITPASTVTSSHILIAQNVTAKNLMTTPFWVQIYRLPFLSKSKMIATALDNIIKEFIDVHEDSFDEGWGPSLRICVRLPVDKPLLRGLDILLKNVAFMERMDDGNDDDLLYGPWMKGAKLPTNGYDKYQTDFSKESISISYHATSYKYNFPYNQMYSITIAESNMFITERSTSPTIPLTASSTVSQGCSAANSLPHNLTPITNLDNIYTPDISSANHPHIPFTTYPPNLLPNISTSGSFLHLPFSINPSLMTIPPQITSTICNKLEVSKENINPNRVFKRHTDAPSMRQMLKRFCNQNNNVVIPSSSKGNCTNKNVSLVFKDIQTILWRLLCNPGKERLGIGEPESFNTSTIACSAAISPCSLSYGDSTQ